MEKRVVREWPAALAAIGIILLTVLFVNLYGCAGKNYVIHPGAVDVPESKMYDVLLFWNGALTQAKEEFAKGKFAPQAKEVINEAGAAYNDMRNIRVAYRSAKLAGRETDAEAKAKEFERFNISVQALIERVLDLILRVTGENYAPPQLNEQWAALPVFQSVGGGL